MNPPPLNAAPSEDRDQALPRALDEGAWEAFLSTALSTPVEVRYGRATREVIQLRRERGRLRLRLGAVMADSPPAVQEALAEWIRTRARRGPAQRTLDAWIDARLRQRARELGEPVALEARGAHHDLSELARELLELEFARDFQDGRVPALGWGRAGRSRSRRSLRLGSFDPFRFCARVHSVLDSPDAPRFFVRYIVFHELLHAVLDEPAEPDRRRRIHGPRFRERERAYGDWERAHEWERRHIGALIASARAGRCLRIVQPAAPSRTAGPKPNERASWLQRLLF